MKYYENPSPDKWDEILKRHEKKTKELIGKLSSLASCYDAQKLRRSLPSEKRTTTENESVYYNVDDIHAAINQNKKIKFKYYKWNIKKELVPRHNGDYFYVSPWALTWDDENYYLVAFDDLTKTMKHYRVDKMMKIALVNEKREGEDAFKQFDMASYTRMNFGMYNGRIEKVKIEFPNSMCGVFIDRFGKNIAFRRIDEEHSYLLVDVAVSYQFFGWIFSLGKEVKVVEPYDVVEKMREAAKEFAANYDK